MKGTGDYQMKHSLLDILIRPGAFFQDTILEKESLKIPGLIVLVLGIVSAFYAFLVGGVTGKMMAGLFSGMESIIAISSVIGAIIGIFIFWAIWAGVFYLISSVFKGNGTFKRTLEFTGYGYLPQIFGAILMVIVAIQYLPRVVVPQIASGAVQEDPQILQEAIKTLMHDPAMMEMTQIASIISIIFLLWSANIWISGMRHARQLSERDSALCVGIPVIIYIIYMIYSMTGI
jgi:hypothetical protein